MLYPLSYGRVESWKALVYQEFLVIWLRLVCLIDEALFACHYSSLLCRHPEIVRGPRQPPVARGERRVAHQGGRQQMQVDPAEPLTHQPMAFDELQYFQVGDDRGGRKLIEEREHFGSSRHLAAGELALDKRMPQHQPLGEPRG